MNGSAGTPLVNIIIVNWWLVTTSFCGSVVADIGGNVMICPFSRGLPKSSYFAGSPTSESLEHHLVLGSWIEKMSVEKRL